MSPPSRYAPPTAQEIERRFRNPAVIVTRPVILGSIGLLQSARCFGWKAAGLENIDRLELPLIRFCTVWRPLLVLTRRSAAAR